VASCHLKDYTLNSHAHLFPGLWKPTTPNMHAKRYQKLIENAVACSDLNPSASPLLDATTLETAVNAFGDVVGYL